MCQANILSTVSITKHINVYPVNLIIFRGDFVEELKLIFSNIFTILLTLQLLHPVLDLLGNLNCQPISEVIFILSIASYRSNKTNPTTALLTLTKSLIIWKDKNENFILSPHAFELYIKLCGKNYLYTSLEIVSMLARFLRFISAGLFNERI